MVNNKDSESDPEVSQDAEANLPNEDGDRYRDIAPSLTINRWQLTFLLIVISLSAAGTALLLGLSVQPAPEPTLDADLIVGTTTWSPDGSAAGLRLAPALIIVNRTDETWQNVSAVLNGQFHFYRKEPIKGGERVEIPLEFFSTRGTSQFYPPVNKLKSLTLYAQLPNGARGVLEKDVEPAKKP